MIVRWIAATFALVASAAAAPLVLHEQVWTTPSEIAAFLDAPGDCYVAPVDPNEARAAEIGRALFRSPVLLGGPAARVGLSCESCHSNGRVNAHFFLPELTDIPGSVDVTSEWASAVRGDGVRNPRPIPDLAGAGARQAFGGGRDPSLEHFIHGVITEEFQGAEPPAAVVPALAAYVRALDASACTASTPLTLMSLANHTRSAFAASHAAAKAGDAATASLVLRATQDELARISERLPATRFARDRADLADLARVLGAARGETGVNAATLDTMAPGWLARFDAIVAHIAPRARQTYFDRTTLTRALAR